MWELGLALSLLAIGSFLTGDRCVTAAALALLANWLLNTIVAWATDDPYPFGLFLGVDYLTGTFMLAGLSLVCGRIALVGIVLALTYALQCVLHAAYGLSDQGEWAQYRYWWALFYIAVGQMLIVFGWGAYELARRHLRSRGRLAPDRTLPARSDRNATPEP